MLWVVLAAWAGAEPVDDTEVECSTTFSAVVPEIGGSPVPSDTLVRALVTGDHCGDSAVELTLTAGDQVETYSVDRAADVFTLFDQVTLAPLTQYEAVFSSDGEQVNVLFVTGDEPAAAPPAVTMTVADQRFVDDPDLADIQGYAFVRVQLLTPQVGATVRIAEDRGPPREYGTDKVSTGISYRWTANQVADEVCFEAVAIAADGEVGSPARVCGAPTVETRGCTCDSGGPLGASVLALLPAVALRRRRRR